MEKQRKKHRNRFFRKTGILLAVLASGCLLLGGCSFPEDGEETAKEVTEGILQTAEEILQSAEETIPKLVEKIMGPDEAPEEPAGETPEPEKETESEKENPIRELFSLFDLTDKEEYTDYLPEEESLFRNRFRTGYYYDCLTEEERGIYEALLAVTDDPASTEYRKGIRTSEDPQSERFGEEINRAYQAMIFDHPERFWFRKESSAFSYYYPALADKDGMYTVEFFLTEAYTDYEAEMTRFNAAVEQFFYDIDLTQPQPAVALQIHDKLMDLVTYDDALADTFRGGGEVFDYGYTAYGALVENSRGQANTAVCDGYSYAYEYLLQQAGITAMRIGGRAGDTAETAYPHSWNLVNLDGEWYETDVTWNDREIEIDPNDPAYDMFLQAMQDEAYWSRIRHHLFQVTTEEMCWFEPDDSYTYYSASGYVSFMGSSVHIRDTEDDLEAEDVLSWMAPYAWGTAYRYEALAE